MSLSQELDDLETPTGPSLVEQLKTVIHTLPASPQACSHCLLLPQALINEKVAPELLPYDHTLVAQMSSRLAKQVLSLLPKKSTNTKSNVLLGTWC